MSDIVPFNFDGNVVRTVVNDGKEYFLAKDVATALGYKSTRNAIARHCEDAAPFQGVIDKLGKKESNIVIQEPDVYALIFNSKLDGAKKFKSWVFNEVLPSLRKTGTYSTEKYLKLQEELRMSQRELCRMEDIFDMRSIYKR